MKVLLIDDESIITEAIKVRLSELIPEQDVDMANSFYYALDLLDAQTAPYDLIISDLLMPGQGLDDIQDHQQGTVLNGWRFLYHYILKPDAEFYEKNKHTNIVIFSAYQAELEQYLSSHNLLAFRERISLLNKGYIYNQTGGFESLIELVRPLLTSTGRQ